MAGKRVTGNENGEFKAALDVGNGEVSGVSSEQRTAVGFEPVIAPMTSKRGLNKADEHPNFSLVKDKETLVFGVEDVFAHGKRDSLRRLNSADRYTSPDYFNLIEVLLLNLFTSQRGKPDRISPTLAINLPVEQFNNETVVNEVKETLSGEHDIMDYDGCTLRLHIKPEKLIVMPESTGALMHWAFDPKNLERRPDVVTVGSTLVVDIGYETTDTTLFEGMKYQRDRAFTQKRTGMGNIARAVHAYVLKKWRDADLSRVDVALRAIAGKKSGEEKWITLPNGEIEVSEVYDNAVSNEAQRIDQQIRTSYTEDVTRALLAGGGTYHLKAALSNLLPFKVIGAPEPELANVIGAYTTLLVRESRRS